MRDFDSYKSLLKNDYQAFAGPDWPTYEDFCSHQDVPDFVYNELDSFLANNQVFDNPAFCVLPFYGIEYPQKTSCCLMLPHDLALVRQQMLNGIRPVACSKCWNLEDVGLTSDRQIKNSMLDHYTNLDISVLYQQAKLNQASIVSYKLDTSTVCNATCITCSPKSSSAWQRLNKKHNHTQPVVFNNTKIKKSTVESVVDFKSAVSINFRGGEPLLSKTNFYILEKLLEHNNNNCFLSFTTNGSITLDSDQWQLLSHFKNLNFNFSIDGVEKVFEYMRYPLSWSTLLENIDICKQHNIPISASYTISNINLLYHQTTTQWFKDNNINYINNPVYYPTHFRPAALSLEVKEKIKQQINHPEVLKFLNGHTPNDDLDFNKAKSEIQKQDALKGINIAECLPDFANLANL